MWRRDQQDEKTGESLTNARHERRFYRVLAAALSYKLKIYLHWKMGGPGRIFREWRQLSDAIAAPSTNALKQSSWYRIRVTRPARSVGLR